MALLQGTDTRSFIHLSSILSLTLSTYHHFISIPFYHFLILIFSNFLLCWCHFHPFLELARTLFFSSLSFSDQVMAFTHYLPSVPAKSSPIFPKTSIFNPSLSISSHPLNLSSTLPSRLDNHAIFSKLRRIGKS